MTPKIIHYCWFGTAALPEMEQRCIDSWKKLLPDYEIKLWNEENFDLDSCVYVRQAYEKKKYAFVSDYARIKALYEYGGIYFDTDVEVLKSLDSFLEHSAFLGFENKTFIGTAVMATKKHGDFAKRMLDYYNNAVYIGADGSENLTTNVTLLDEILVSKGLIKNNTRQTVDGIEIFSRDVFFPKKISETEFRVTTESVTIHRMSGTWLTERQKKRGSNKFWINVCRPTLRFVQKIILSLLGEERTKKIELWVRNKLK